MLLEKSTDWTTIDAYVTRAPSLWQLLRARAEWAWLAWRAGAATRRKWRAQERLRDAARMLPVHVRRDIGLM